MPAIIKSCPNAIYVILGATHPNLVRNEGEAYRDSLTARVRELGIEDHVIFYNQFVDQATLLDFISMCDVYVTPYLNEVSDDVGHARLQLRAGKGRRIDALLARQGIAGRRARRFWFHLAMPRRSAVRFPAC